MNKYILSLLFLLLVTAAFGQNKSKLNLISSETSEYTKGPNGKIIGKVHKGVFKQDYSILTSDSAYFYPDLNMVDAFGHVNINQGDTLNIYSDKLNYNGNTKVAILTNHVKMVDKDATLTTNYFTYNTATRIGIYTGGGKLVNKDNTLVSKNGYYFAFTRDEYFRYDVVCTTPDAVIKTDTLRYNSGSRIAYFYGPTNILGKDKDNLYTENGTYNTINEQAFFGKNNLYTSGTKSLKGDSLFYDRLKGYGRAVKHVTFTDSEQKATIKGDLGEYYKADDRTVMTQNPYMIFVTEDSTANTAANAKVNAESLSKDKRQKIDANTDKAVQALTNITAGKKLSLQGIIDAVTKKLAVENINETNKQALKNIADSAIKKLPANKNISETNKQALKNAADSAIKKLPANKNISPANKLTLKGITDSVTKKLGPQVNAKTLQKLGAPKNTLPYKPADTIKATIKPNTRQDSLLLVADTLETQILTYKALKVLQASMIRDTSIKIVKKAPPIVYTKSPKVLLLDAPKHWPKDTSFLHPYYFGKPAPRPAPKPVPVKVVKPAPPKKPLSAQDSLKLKKKADSLLLYGPKVLTDTSRIRIITGHHNAKLFKSDLQAKADSMFYSSSDSTIRCYVNPMIWTQGSQLSGDTINLQMKNKKLDNLDMFPAAFIVNVEKGDSVHFNQAGGKKMHGTFKNNKLNTMYIVGNAETIYFKRDSATNKVTDMSRTVSGKIYVTFKNGEIATIAFNEKYEGKGYPLTKTKEEDRILKGFIWKPKERPISKEALLSAFKSKTVPVKPPSAKTNKPPVKTPDKPALKKPTDNKPVKKDTVAAPPAVKLAADSALKNNGAKKDSVVKKDTSLMRKSILIKQK